MSNGINLLFGMMSLPQILGGYNPPVDYAPAWESTHFTYPALTSEGWFDESPEVSSDIVYVSSDGDDGTATVYSLATLPSGTWRNPSGVSAFATVQAAIDAVSDNATSYVLLKRGDSWVQSGSSLTAKGGVSETAHSVISSYGNILDPMPVIDTDLMGGYILQTLPDYLSVTEIKFTCTRNDYDHVNFAGWGNISSVGGIYSNNATVQGLYVEDCWFDFLEIGVYLKGTDTNQPTRNIVRRNRFSNAYMHGFGLLLTHTSTLQEDNVFHKCGYFSKYQGSLIGTLTDNFNATLTTALTGASETTLQLSANAPVNLPAGKSVVVTLDGGGTESLPIVSMSGTSVTIDATDFTGDNASIGNAVQIEQNKVERGEVALTTTALLNSAATTAIDISLTKYDTTAGDLSDDYREGMVISLVGDLGTLYDIPITSASGTQFVIPSTDFSADPVSSGTMIRAHVFGAAITTHSVYATSDHYSIHRRMVSFDPSAMHLKLATGAAINILNAENIAVYDNLFAAGELGISAGGNGSSTTQARFGNVEINANYLIDLGIYDNSDRGIGWGIDHLDNQNSNYTRNFMLNRTEPANAYAVRVDGLADNDTVLSNVSYNAGGFPVTSDTAALEMHGNIRDNANFASWTTIPQFLTSIGETGDIQEFAELMLTRHKYNWLTHDADYKALLKSESIPSSPLLITDIASANIIQPASYDFIVDAYSPYDITYQYTLDTSEISGATSREYSTGATTAGSYDYQCVITDENGSVNSSIATLAVASGAYHVTFNGTNAYATPQFLNATAGTEFYYEAKVKASSAFILLGQTGGYSYYFGSSGSANALRIVINGTAYDAPSGVLAHDGAEHTMAAYRVANNDIYLALDGVAYLVGNDSDSFSPNHVARSSSDYWDVEVWDLNYETYNGSFDFLMNQVKNNGETESSTLDTATMTYSNTTGLWSVV